MCLIFTPFVAFTMEEKQRRSPTDPHRNALLAAWKGKLQGQTLNYN
jgi:hypothetical protein